MLGVQRGPAPLRPVCPPKGRGARSAKPTEAAGSGVAPWERLTTGEGQRRRSLSETIAEMCDSLSSACLLKGSAVEAEEGLLV